LADRLEQTGSYEDTDTEEETLRSIEYEDTMDLEDDDDDAIN
jgi:hypothetical protein